MKKKIIIFGSLLAVLLMLMIPNVSAIEYNTVKSTVEKRINESVQTSIHRISKNAKNKIVQNLFSSSRLFYVLIVILYLISLPLSVITGLFTRSIDTGLSWLNSFLEVFPPVVFPALVLMLTEHLAKTDFHWFISFILYMIVNFLSGFLIGRLEPDKLKKSRVLHSTFETIKMSTQGGI